MSNTQPSNLNLTDSLPLKTSSELEQILLKLVNDFEPIVIGGEKVLLSSAHEAQQTDVAHYAIEKLMVREKIDLLIEVNKKIAAGKQITVPQIMPELLKHIKREA